MYSKICVKRPLSKNLKNVVVFIPIIAQCRSKVMHSALEHSVTRSTFIKLPFVIKTFVLSIVEWPFYTGFWVSWFIKTRL